MKCELLSSLTLTEEERNNLEINSRGQSLCNLWLVERKKRLTASNFGKICRLKPKTPCQKTVVQLLYTKFTGNAATR